MAAVDNNVTYKNIQKYNNSKTKTEINIEDFKVNQKNVFDNQGKKTESVNRNTVEDILKSIDKNLDKKLEDPIVIPKNPNAKQIDADTIKDMKNSLINAGKNILNSIKENNTAGNDAMLKAYSNGLDNGKGIIKSTIDADIASLKARLDNAKEQTDKFVEKHEKGLQEAKDRIEGAAAGAATVGGAGYLVAGVPGAVVGGIYGGVVGAEAGMDTLKSVVKNTGSSINKNLVRPVVDTAKNVKNGVETTAEKIFNNKKIEK